MNSFFVFAKSYNNNINVLVWWFHYATSGIKKDVSDLDGQWTTAFISSWCFNQVQPLLGVIFCSNFLCNSILLFLFLYLVIQYYISIFMCKIRKHKNSQHILLLYNLCNKIFEYNTFYFYFRIFIYLTVRYGIKGNVKIVNKYFYAIKNVYLTF